MKSPIFAGFVACLTCLSSGLRAQTPIVVPLINFQSTGQLGIHVLIGTNPIPHPYILDTGSFAFATAMGSGPSWTGSTYTDTGVGFDISYGTGALQYIGNVATATVTLSNANGDALAAVNNATLGVITNQPYPNWNAEINSDPAIPPESPASHQFFGTFGAGLSKTESGLSSILGQMAPAGLTQGFIIHTGGSASTSATLSIGLTAGDLASFPIQIPMNPSTGTFLTSTGVTVNLYPESQVSADYHFEHDSQVYNHTGNMVIDSGGLGTHFQTDDTLPDHISDGSELIAGTLFSAKVAGITGNSGLDWSFLAGTTEFGNKVGVTSGTGTLNTGIAIYYQYDILFDIEHGIVGLRPTVVPEPSTYALLAGGVIFVLAVWRRRRRA